MLRNRISRTTSGVRSVRQLFERGWKVVQPVSFNRFTRSVSVFEQSTKQTTKLGSTRNWFLLAALLPAPLLWLSYKMIWEQTHQQQQNIQGKHGEQQHIQGKYGEQRQMQQNIQEKLQQEQQRLEQTNTVVAFGLGFGETVPQLFNTLVEHTEAAVRFVRACYYVGRIMISYKLFFNRQLESGTEEYREQFSATNRQVAELLLALCNWNQGSYIKAGQYLASLQYVLPQEITEKLSVLQDRAPCHSLEQSIRIFRQVFQGRSPSDIFEHFESEPIASASIAQVHVARLRDTGEKVAVKVQHPELERLFRGDIQTMRFLQWIVQQTFDFQLQFILPEFERMVNGELDFVNEASNCERLSHIFRDNQQVVCPRIHWELTNARVITMEFMEGYRVTEVAQMERDGISKQEVAELIARAYGKQIFEYGFVHADPHGGNIHVRMNHELGRPQIVILDHGCYKELDEQTRLNYAGLWYATVFRNEPQMFHYTEAFRINPKYAKLLGTMLTMSNMMIDDSDIDGTTRNTTTTATTGTGWIVDQRERRNTRKLSPEQRKEMAKRIKLSLGFDQDQELSVFQLMQDMLGNVNPDFLLLSRTNAYIRSLMYLYDRPINSFAITAEYCIRGFHTKLSFSQRTVHTSDHHQERVIPLAHVQHSSWRESVHLQWQLFKLRCTLLLFEWLRVWHAWWYRESQLTQLSA